MKAKGAEPVLPDNPAPHLTDWFLEIGPTATNGDGPVGWVDMLAWQELTGIHLDPWEARTIRRLSRTFLSQRHDARNPACMEPRIKVDQDATRKKVDDQFAAMMAAIAGMKKAA